jgi:two-component system cell cycle response regulator
MGIYRERRFAEPHVGERSSNRAEGRPNLTSKTLALDSTPVTDGDTRGMQTLRGIYSQTSAKLLPSSPWEQSCLTDRADQGSASATGPRRSGTLSSLRRRVLVAENDPEVRLQMQNWLQGWGYQVLIAMNGPEAWEILQQERPPELVIMNRIMPDIEGVELSRRLRHEQRDYYHYILLITDTCAKRDIGHALESGADDYLMKPFGRDDLRARLTVASRILSLQDHLIQAREGLLDQATKDALTGVWNRPALLELFQRELDRASRVNTSTGLLILDLDHFKAVNDTYGHLTGDLALKETARRLKCAVRSYDLVGRYGGEEFLIVFPDCSREQLCRIAENVRLAVGSKPVLVGTVEIPISLSIGAVSVAAEGRSAGNMLAVADVALYQAKNTGRNRTVYCQRASFEILQSKDTHSAFCAQCACGPAKTCTVQSQGAIDLNQRIDGNSIGAEVGLPQIPIGSNRSIEPSVAYPL